MKSLQEQVNSAPKQHQLDRLVSLVYLLLIPSLFLVEGAELQIPFGGASHRFPYEKFEEKKVAVKYFARAHRVGCPTKVSGILECPVVAQRKALLATLSLTHCPCLPVSSPQ